MSDAWLIEGLTDKYWKEFLDTAYRPPNPAFINSIGVWLGKYLASHDNEVPNLADLQEYCKGMHDGIYNLNKTFYREIYPNIELADGFAEEKYVEYIYSIDNKLYGVTVKGNTYAQPV